MQFQYPDHTFVVRVAPAQSAYAGQVCCELRCPGNLKVMQPLKDMGIDYARVEWWQHPVKGWKLYRFSAPIADLLKLHEACAQPDIDAINQETHRHLAEMSIDIAAQHIDSYTVKQLRDLAKQAGITNVSRMKKADLLAALTMPVAVAA